MHKTLGILGTCLVLAGCGQMGLDMRVPSGPGDGQTRPQSRPDAMDAGARRPPATARTAEEFDTTTAEERQAAAAPASEAQARSLGLTVVSLGDPARPGFWIETPLATSVGRGRVINPETGQSVQLDLIPVDGSGSRMSLAALRVIGIPLTGLTEVEVVSGG